MARICDIIKKNFVEKAEKKLYNFFEGYQVSESVTYKEFGERVNAFSGYLQSVQSQGERALILLPSGINYLTAYFSCLFSQTIAVPLYDINEQKQIPTLKHIIQNCDAAYIITEKKYVQKLTEWLGDDAEELVFCLVDEFTPKPYIEPEIPDDSVAYLQYTSGSTSSAKGVKITYDNIFATCRNMQNHLALSENDIYVTWIPLYFDMGLIGANVNPILTGGSGCFTSPAAFMKQPDSLFNAVSVYRGTILVAPNFAYDMCLKLPEEFFNKLDLSSVRLTVNGSELVRNKTLNALALRMQQFGLNPKSFNPSYGLAENTLVVSSHAPGTGYKYVTVDERKMRENVIEFSENGLDIVSCGRVCCGMELKIIDLSTQDVLGEDRIGEIWITGDSVAAGYWSNEAESGFNQFLPGDEAEYYATGDLGFMHEEHLYIVGRKKDVIIIRGKNLYSQDIEELILHSAEDQLETAVAFAIDDQDDEQLIVIAETDHSTDDQQLISKINNTVVTNCGIIPAEILLKPVGYLVRTNSGKVQRQACKKQYLESRKK